MISGGEGKISGRKRVRGKIGNPTRSFELKQFNLFDTTENGTSFFWGEKVYGIYSNEVLGVWHPIGTVWPKLGPAVGERIGKSIRVKYLRIKGYVAASPFLITQVRYRLVLYRVRKNIVTVGEGEAAHQEEVYDQAWLKSLYYLYHNPEEQDYGGTSLKYQETMAFNYYLSYFDPEAMKAHDCKRRVILKGLLKPQSDIGNFSVSTDPIGNLKLVANDQENKDYYWETGASAAAGEIRRQAKYALLGNGNPWLLGEFQKHNTAASLPSEINSRAFFPIDVTVEMNDNVDTWEYRYVFVFESDWGVGQDATGYYSNTTSNSNFFIRFIPQIYYTDD